MRWLSACLVLTLVACGPKPPAGSRNPAVTDTPVERTEPAHPTTLRVDHAWVKDAEKPSQQPARRKGIEDLRARVAAGAGFNDAWNAMHLDANVWHVAEQETYPYGVIPAAARDLPKGSLSPVIPGDGGLHLFRIIERLAD